MNDNEKIIEQELIEMDIALTQDNQTNFDKHLAILLKYVPNYEIRIISENMDIIAKWDGFTKEDDNYYYKGYKILVLN